MEEHEVKMKSESDDSDSDDNSDQETKLQLANIDIFKREILEDPGNYDAHMGLIKSLRKIGELEDLRIAREEMNRIFPLSPELWIDWVSDEQKICTSITERKYISELFERAVDEYMSVQIWVEYIMFILGGGKMDETRTICEKALTAVGIHLAEGILVWQAVLLVEQQFFESLSQEEDKKIVDEQKKNIQNLYRRQARVPLMNQNKEQFLNEVEKWFDGEVDPQIRKDLDNSLKKVLEKLPYEEALLRASDETEKLEAYRKYIDFVRRSDNPAVIQNLYERTITELCLNAGIWEEYVRFLMEQFSNAHFVILPVCRRSQLNCQWSSTLFELHITAIQMFAEAIGPELANLKIKMATEKTLECDMIEIELIKSWMAYLVYLRMKIKWDEETPEHLKEFRKTCTIAMSSIDEKLGDEGDKECTVARFQAKVEAESAKDMEIARSLWNDVIMKKNNNFKKASFWLEFINLERSYGSEKHCRKLYRRALERVWDDIEMIGSSFLQFEQELGNLETMMDFDKRYRDRMPIVQKKRMDNTMKEEAKKAQNKFKGKGKEERLPTSSSLKPKHKQSLQHKEEERSNLQKSHKGKKRTFSESMEDPDMSSKGKKRTFSESVEDSDMPPGYEKQDLCDLKKQKVTDHGEFVEHDSSLDHRTVFLSNMDYNAKEDEVLTAFLDCGDVDTFRITKDYKGRSKGYAYLVFKDGASVLKALAKDRTPVCGRPLFISRCDPINRHKAFTFATGLEKEKLFVKGLPFRMSEEEVKAFFEPHGDVKSLRLVTFRNGLSKGICYIEYHNAETAKNVQKKMNQTEVEGHKITVLISNPMNKNKNENTNQRHFLPTPVASGSDRQRPKLSLVPRALLRNSVSTDKEDAGDKSSNGKEENGNGNSNGAGETAPKSNEDFRKMFFK